jgi:hypothetical protein
MADDAATLAAKATNAQDPIEGLRAVAELREMIERLEAHQVDRAVERGWSWAQVARPLGISKQAAHRRHATRPPVVLEQAAPGSVPEEPQVVISGDARAVVARAREEAATLGDPTVQPSHLLAALLQPPAGPAQDALLALGVDLDAVRAALRDDRPRKRSNRFTRRPTIDPVTRQVFERSLGETQRLCHGHLGPEHLLLALLRDEDGPAVALLQQIGASTEEVETAVCDVLKNTDFARSL